MHAQAASTQQILFQHVTVHHPKLINKPLISINRQLLAGQPATGPYDGRCSRSGCGCAIKLLKILTADLVDASAASRQRQQTFVSAARGPEGVKGGRSPHLQQI